MIESESFGCKRCGYCCIYLTVVISRPVPDGTLQYYYKPNDLHCPHLTFEGPQAKCAIHEHAAYKECPCDLHNNWVYDPDICCWGDKWRCIGPTLVEQGIFTKRPPMVLTYGWEELINLND